MTTISPRRVLLPNQVATLKASLGAAVTEVGEAEDRNHSSEWAVQHLAQQLEKEKQARNRLPKTATSMAMAMAIYVGVDSAYHCYLETSKKWCWLHFDATCVTMSQKGFLKV